MDYRRKEPIDYADVAENLRNPAWYDIEDGTTLLDDAAAAITDLLKYKEAIDRIGRFGTLFVQYSGDPRGPVGTMGAVSDQEIEHVLMMEPIEDVEGDKWRPVGEGWLQQLIERTKAAEARCKRLEEARERSNESAHQWEGRCKILETRLETAEKMVKEYQDVIVPGYRERAEKAESELKEAPGMEQGVYDTTCPELETLGVRYRDDETEE